ncbi:hypothetical protein HGQ62_06525 [Stenotrophomonas maltophilia]|nr:hypothetical protein [Stenotrophomonas maltophilia]NMT71958.1 hypothetical protein [Stenotrophomonas maltophilia]
MRRRARPGRTEVDMNTRKTKQVPKWLAAIAMAVTTFVGTATAQTVTYIHTDALGSPVAETDASGNVIKRFAYEPYGAVVGGEVADGPGYTGHVSDAATGLSYMQQRYMDPELGVFLSVDPVTAYVKGDMRHFNAYAYAYNNPYTFNDPDGRCGACDGFSDSYASMSTPEREGLRSAMVSAVRAVVTAFSELNSPASGGGGKVGAAGAVIKEAQAGSALVRAKEINGALKSFTQTKVTTAVTETKEGVRVVTSSEGRLRPAQRNALKDGEVAGKGVPGVHAEVNGVNSARTMGLTPTSVSPSRPACPGCQSAMKQENVKIIDK